MGDFEDVFRPEDVVEVERLFAGLPITVNVGFPSALGGPGSDTTIIGRAHAYRNKEDGRATVVMMFDPEASELLGNLTEVFEIRGMGFAGIKREPQDGA